MSNFLLVTDKTEDGLPIGVSASLAAHVAARLGVPLLQRLGHDGERQPGSPALTVEAPLDPSRYDLDPGDHL